MLLVTSNKLPLQYKTLKLKHLQTWTGEPGVRDGRRFTALAMAANPEHAGREHAGRRISKQEDQVCRQAWHGGALHERPGGSRRQAWIRRDGEAGRVSAPGQVRGAPQRAPLSLWKVNAKG